MDFDPLQCFLMATNRQNPVAKKGLHASEVRKKSEPFFVEQLRSKNMKLAMMAGPGSGPESIDKWKAGLCLKYHAETDALTTESK